MERHGVTLVKRVGIYGGSFNPIHLAHLVLAEQAAEILDLDPVIFVPARLPPHKDPGALASAQDRLRMARLAVAGNSRFRVSDIELRRRGRSYTIDTVKAFRKRFGRRAEICFLIGTDTIEELPTWKQVGRLVKLCTFVPLTRPGARRPRISALASAIGKEEARRFLRRVLKMPQLDISASDIRARVSAGRSIRYLVPGKVEAYIRRKGLYQRSETPARSGARATHRR